MSFVNMTDTYAQYAPHVQKSLAMLGNYHTILPVSLTLVCIYTNPMKSTKRAFIHMHMLVADLTVKIVQLIVVTGVVWGWSEEFRPLVV